MGSAMTTTRSARAFLAVTFALASLLLLPQAARAQTPPADDPAAGGDISAPDDAAAPDDTAAPDDGAADDTAAPDDTSAPGPMASATDATPSSIRLRQLAQRVQALKEQAWRVKARVGMLKEAVLGGGIGARATIAHENKMGGSFRLVKLVYALDGSQIFARTDDSGKLHDQKNIEILSGPIAPGNHTISVLMEYRGHGYGVFSYLKGYKFTVRSSHTFTAAEGRQTSITVVGYERGGVTTPLEKRPAVDFRVNVVADGPKGK